MSNVETTVTHIGAPPPEATAANPSPKGDNVTKNANAQLLSVVSRIEAMEEEKKTISDDIGDIYKEAKGNGFDIKALRGVVRMRKIDTTKRHEQDAILETYMLALGML